VAALAGAVASFFLARKASLPVATILVALPLLAYLASYYGLQYIGQNADKTFGHVGEQIPPALPEGRPAPSAPSGGGPQSETEMPAKPEAAPPSPAEAASPPPPSGGEGGTLGATEDNVEAQSEQQAAEIAEQRAKEEAKRQAEEEEAAKAAAPPTAENGEIIVGGHAPEQLPEFPWPPPRASASYVLPDRLLASYHTVGDVVGAIIEALEQGGYVERSFFQTKAGGVALVTRLERINDDGTSSAETQRWPNTGDPYGSSDSLFQFLQGLFYVDPGHYRVIVFVLQDLPFSQSSTDVTAGEARAWLTRGANVLPPDIAARSFAGAHCTALIYEFASDGTKVHVVESRLTGKEHLEKAGLLAALGTTH
jgi:hypothetical protein